MSLSDVIQTALEKINYIAKTETVIGEPIVAGDVTLIPVSKISIGFAAGGGGNE
ncbi:MAG: sporulation protein, partial [Chitinivibrionales bacterium]|nr:sporulation protein [Chitinivibrionales bacterium]